MSYFITYRDGGKDFPYETLENLDDARQAYEKAIEELKDAESIRLLDRIGDTIESHIF
jgi:hypothetical protein|tara:strand:- start:429 stop:602 length:174 start_codon:yes stop_codon:yes gene_type:complete